MSERYRRVFDRGYQQAAADLTLALAQFLGAGGRIEVKPFSDDLMVRFPEGLVAEMPSLLALLPYKPEAAWRLTGGLTSGLVQVDLNEKLRDLLDQMDQEPTWRPFDSKALLPDGEPVEDMGS